MYLDILYNVFWKRHASEQPQHEPSQPVHPNFAGSCGSSDEKESKIFSIIPCASSSISISSLGNFRVIGLYPSHSLLRIQHLIFPLLYNPLYIIYFSLTGFILKISHIPTSTHLIPISHVQCPRLSLIVR